MAQATGDKDPNTNGDQDQSQTTTGAPAQTSENSDDAAPGRQIAQERQQSTGIGNGQT